jgi:radical SAM superfamily enzyme YgiQ (UPF0313 family)
MTPAYDCYIGILPDSNFATIQSDSITCPLGQLVIASYAREKIPGLEAVVYNGLRTSKTEIFERIEGAVSDRKIAVGITLTAGNTLDGFEFAEKAHDMGADVFIGGTETTMCKHYILSGRPYIKAAIIGAGEKPMTKILSGKPLSQIDSLAYEGRISGKCPCPTLDFKNIRVDYSLLDKLEEHNGLSYLYGNDCALVHKRCYFCGRPKLGAGFRNPDVVWGEIADLYECGIARFYNTMDNAAVNMRRLREFALAKPDHLRFDQHRTFINATDVNEESISYLKKINALASIGLENFALMEKVGKGDTRLISNLRALQMIGDAKIPLFLSMVLGIPGETQETLEENVQWIDFIFNEFGEVIDQFLVSPLVITTGSRAYQDLMSLPDMQRKYGNRRVPYDVFEMSEDYFAHFCEVSRTQVLEQITAINKRIKEKYPRVTISGHIQHNEVLQVKGITSEEKEKIAKP